MVLATKKEFQNVEEKYRDPQTRMPLRCDLPVRQRVHVLPRLTNREVPHPFRRGTSFDPHHAGPPPKAPS